MLFSGSVLGGFLLASLAVASSGILFKPGAWYRILRKPSWTPPNRAFPIVWSVLYVMIAVSGWLAWRAGGFPIVPFGIFATQLVLNFLWSMLFFGWRRPDLAFLDIVLLWLAVALNILLFWPLSTLAALLLVPYLVWVTVAASLNLALWRLNRENGAFA